MTEHSMTLAQVRPLFAQEAAPPIAGGQPSLGAATQGDPGLGPQDGAGQPAPFGGAGFLWVILLMFMFMIGMQVFAGRKERKKRAAMLGSLARHDRIQTVGGLIGTVAEVRDSEVVLKVDESTNTKVRVARGAVQQILKKANERDKSDPSDIADIAEPEKINS